ncbi:gliding motility lipoprotein GldH [Aquiflexum sp.]|uniref:gliding motility lipoprotein GldH n=1 Tax=Aquiflexum sp. TaxID=1872584 RepID=UPI0035946576
MTLKSKVILLLLCVLMLGCDKSRLFEKYQGMETGSWNIADTVSFDLPKISDSHKTIVGIKYNDDYEFRNLYLTYLLKDSLGQIIETQLLEIPLFDNKSGKPLGSGFGITFTKYDTLPLLTNNSYSKIQLLQYMRMDEIVGIEAVGVKIVK